MPARRDAASAPTMIERFVKALVVTYKAVLLYPPASNIPNDTAAEAERALGEALQERPELRLVVTKNGLFYSEVPIFPDNPAYDSFALDLYHRRLADVRFHAGASARDLVAFLGILKVSPEEVEAAGGFESRLWDQGVATVTVTEASVAIVDGGSLLQSETDLYRLPSARSEIDELLATAYGGRARDQVTVARLIAEPEAVTKYLEETYASGGGLSALMDTGERFAELAEIAWEVGENLDRAALMKSLGEALGGLDPDVRRSLVFDEVLPQARTNEALASVIRQMDVDDLCRMLVEDMDADKASQEGMARAIRNLAMISMAEREEVVTAAGAAMRGAGFSEGMVEDVIEMASPSRLTVRNQAPTAAQSEQPVDTIFRLMDMAPGADRLVGSEDDPGVVELQNEARRGITDGDIIMALVSLVGIDQRDQQFASTMAMLEDSLDLLIERGELDIAADAADALKAASDDETLSADKRKRLSRAIRRFTRPADIRAVAHALRIYKPGTVEHDSARRLLDALGADAIDPLLEQLADEPDMAVRKSLIDVLSELAPDNIAEFAKHMNDPRWYVVRNVVAILGSTKSSAVLHYLERTVRHGEPRVRRETIRALSGITDRLATEMLIAALADDDAQNVQLAARYLGASGARGAIPALEQVARGDGRGNRDSGPRVEAIETLGRLGAVEALPTLEALAGKRSILGAARAREMRAAAETAIARIKARGGGQ